MARVKLNELGAGKRHPACPKFASRELIFGWGTPDQPLRNPVCFARRSPKTSLLCPQTLPYPSPKTPLSPTPSFSSLRPSAFPAPKFYLAPSENSAAPHPKTPEVSAPPKPRPRMRKIVCPKYFEYSRALSTFARIKHTVQCYLDLRLQSYRHFCSLRDGSR